MAASKKAQEDKNLKVLRELAALPANRQCMDCHQRGPTYVNTTIWSFVCTACSGRLRGLSPPHRVKSISMTTFSQAEIEQLRKGGNEVAKAKWLGLWNERMDKMPDSKDDHGLMEFMREKYEKKRWFTTDSAPKQEEVTRRPSLGKPPQKEKKTPTSSGSMSLRQRPQISPGPEGGSGGDVKQQQQQQQQQQTSLLDTSSTSADPFAPAPTKNAVRPPVGGVAVLPGVAAVLKPKTQKSPSSDSFGAFTSATSTDGLLSLASTQNETTSLGNASLSPAQSTGQLGSSLTSSGGDKYSALADLDSQIKDLKVVDTPPSQPPAAVPAVNPFGSAVPAQNGTQVGGGNMWAGQGGVTPPGSGFNAPNPFGGSAPNPFQSGAGPMMQGGANQNIPGNWSGTQFGAPQQPFTAAGMQPQMGAAVGGVQGFQGNAAPQGYMGVGVAQVGQFGQQTQWSGAGFAQSGNMAQQQQQQSPFGQMGATQLGYPQQQVQGFGAPQGQFGGGAAPQGQFGTGAPQGQFGGGAAPQGQFGTGAPQGQFGGGSAAPQGQFVSGGVPQGQFGGGGMAQGQFGAGGMAQGQFGAGGMAQGQFGGGGMPQGQFGGSGMSQGQFGGSTVPQGQAGGGNFQWGKTQQPSSVATSGAPKASSSQTSTSASASTPSLGWSTDMTKPVPPSSSSISPAVSLSLGGWSENILVGSGSHSLSSASGSVQGSSGMSGWAGQSSTPISGWTGQSGTPTSGRVVQSGTSTGGWAGQSGTPTGGWAGQSGTPTSGWAGQSGTPTSGWAGQSGTPTSGWAGQSGTSTGGWAGQSGTPTSGWVGQSGTPTSGWAGQSPSVAQQQNWATGGGAVQPTFGASTQGFTNWTGSSAPNAAAGNPFGQTAQAKSTNPFL